MFIQFESKKTDKNGFQNIYFEHPVYVITCSRLDEVRKCISRMDEALKKGYHLAGFFSYEMGYALEEALYFKKEYDFPLIWFGVFKNCNPLPADRRPLTGKNKYYENLKMNISRNEYNDSFRKIKKLIADGETYQVNYTFKYKFDFIGDAMSLYEELKGRQSVPYSAFIDGDNFKIISLSPEMFIVKNGENITVEPMKGTLSRGINSEEDKNNMLLLSRDKKSRSENIMIVDLLRNDLGKIAKNKSVKATNLFDVKKYETLLQMTSRINAKTDKNIYLLKLLSAMFPSGSVTGAPKLRTIEIIKSLEKEDRKIYTGSIGYITPKKDMVFNIAIRTVLLSGNKGEIGIGSGIVADSIADNEYEECKLKADFFTKDNPKFELIETLLWEKGSFFLLKGHMERLQKSCEYFGFKFNKKNILLSLENAKREFSLNNWYKVRLFLGKTGHIQIDTDEILSDPHAKKNTNIVFISTNHTRSDDVFLYHKTTNRGLYNNEYKKYTEKGFIDVIFQNERNEITEGAISNIFIRKRNRIFTPAIKSGLLNGIYRQDFINKNKNVIEKILYVEDLINADELLLCNSVKGMVKVSLARTIKPIDKN